MQSESKQLIVVLGMHRSGTSAITRGLKVLGVELGDKLIAAVEGDNSKGYWEDSDLNTLNIEMLYSIGSDWHNLTPIDHFDVEHYVKKATFLRPPSYYMTSSKITTSLALKTQGWQSYCHFGPQSFLTARST